MPTIIIIVREKILNVKHFPTPLTDNDVKSFAEKNGITKKYVVRDKKDKILFPKDFPLNENVWINTHYDDINSDKYYYEKFRVTYGETEYCIRCIDYPDTYIMVNTNKNKIQRITKILNENKVIDMSLFPTGIGKEDDLFCEGGYCGTQKEQTEWKRKKEYKLQQIRKNPYYLINFKKMNIVELAILYNGLKEIGDTETADTCLNKIKELYNIAIYTEDTIDILKFCKVYSLIDKKKIESDIWSTD
jgi:hypothetical protein